jgi:hypothetical protein
VNDLSDSIYLEKLPVITPATGKSAVGVVTNGYKDNTSTTEK